MAKRYRRASGLATLLANATGGRTPLAAILPQLALSLVVHPLVTRGVALLDRLRLVPVSRVRR